MKKAAKKRSPEKTLHIKVLALLLITFIIGLAGSVVQNINTAGITEKYKQMTDELYERDLITSNISSLIYHHQVVVNLHLMAQDDETKEMYSEQESILRTKIRAKMEDLGELMRQSTREQLFHNVFSDTQSYFSNCDIVMYISSSGSSATADYYVQTMMPDFVSRINHSLDEMDTFTTEETNAARADMARLMKFTVLCSVISISSLVISSAISVYLCFRLTASVERHKDDLQSEVLAKTRELTERNRELTAFRNNTVIGLAILIESRDGETGEHIMRTSAYVKMLANAAREQGVYADELTDEFIDLLVRAAPMHDIGKISVPDTILKKPGKLTDEEFEIMKKHAAEGERIVREVLGNIAENDYMEIAAKVAGGHHEKWNGTGYPYRLSGDSIPLEARIMALADVFDALVSKRCYKDPIPPEKAFEIIEESAGTHFDPELARVFLSIKNEITDYLEDNLD